MLAGFPVPALAEESGVIHAPPSPWDAPRDGSAREPAARKPRKKRPRYDEEGRWLPPELPKYLDQGLLVDYLQAVLPRAPGGDLHESGRYDHKTRSTRAGWTRLGGWEGVGETWPWRQRWTIGMALAGRWGLGCSGATLVRYVAVEVQACHLNRLGDALAHLRARVTLEAHRMGFLAFFWLGGDYPAGEARDCVAGLLRFHAVPFAVPRVQPLPGTRGGSPRELGDPSSRPFVRELSTGRCRLDREAWVRRVVADARELGVAPAKFHASWGEAPHVRGTDPKVSTTLQPIDHNGSGGTVSHVGRGGPGASQAGLGTRVQPTTKTSERAPRERARPPRPSPGTEWQRIDSQGVGAGLRRRDWVAWSFGWWVRHAAATVEEFVEGALAWWDRTGGGRSNDAAEDPVGTRRQVATWARRRGAQLRAEIDAGRVRPLAGCVGERELEPGDSLWLQRRARRLGADERQVGQLEAFAGWLYARPRWLAIHARNVWVRFGGAGYQALRDLAERVFVLARVGGYSVGQHAQRYERGIELGAQEGPVDAAGRPMLLDLGGGQGRVAGWDWRGRLRAVWSWCGVEKMARWADVAEGARADGVPVHDPEEEDRVDLRNPQRFRRARWDGEDERLENRPNVHFR